MKTQKPRGPSYGPKKLKPKGIPRRTGSIELSRHLQRVNNFLSHSGVDLPLELQAELRAIQERNVSGTWTKNDVARAERIANNLVGQRKKLK